MVRRAHGFAARGLDLLCTAEVRRTPAFRRYLLALFALPLAAVGVGGGVVAIDNVLRGGDSANPSSPDPETHIIRRFNEQVRDDPRVATTLLPMRDGLTLALKI